MVKYENYCCSCDPCRGSICPNRKVPVHYCDKCGEELDKIYDVDGEELCESCLKEMFLKKR